VFHCPPRDETFVGCTGTTLYVSVLQLALGPLGRAAATVVVDNGEIAGVRLDVPAPPLDRGDLVRAIGGRRVTDLAALRALVHAQRARTTIVVRRGGGELVIDVVEQE
jgi:S1-C subfamily serine protease